MLPVPDFRGAAVAFWVVLSLPIFLGAVFVVLAACTGQRRSRRSGSCAIVQPSSGGSAGGWLVAWLALPGSDHGMVLLFEPWQVLASLTVVAASSLLGAAAAYHLARRLATRPGTLTQERREEP
jgi:hypothetical protein